MTDINQLIEDLESRVDSGSERVADLFRQLRESVPRPMTLVFKRRGVWRECKFFDLTYDYSERDGLWYGSCAGGPVIVHVSETAMIAAMQAHFNAAWSAMTAKGAATNGA